MEDKSEVDILFDKCIQEKKNLYKKYTVEFKLYVIKLIELGVSLHKISEKLDIDRHFLWDWRDKRNALEKVNNENKAYRCNRLLGLNTFFTEEEEFQIVKWIADNRDKYIPISTKSLISYAGDINVKFKEKPVQRKLTWACRFLKRRGFSIRRISHVGQTLPKEKNDIKSHFIAELIKLRKNLGILYEENYRIINMEEKACFLEMNTDTTIDFVGKKSIEIITKGSDKYRISVLLSVTGNGQKLPALVIVKGQEAKTIEKKLNTLYYVKNSELFIWCQKDRWCTSDIFCYWIREVFLPYEKFVCDKCILIIDSATYHKSNESIDILNKYNINYIFIPPGMTPELQPLDISVNKIFKDNIKLRFEEQRICYDKLNPKVKLTTARLNLIDYIYNIWKNDNIISRDIIINGFKHACLINNYYLSNEEERINDLNTYNLINEDKNDIIDDLGQEILYFWKRIRRIKWFRIRRKRWKGLW